MIAIFLRRKLSARLPGDEVAENRLLPLKFAGLVFGVHPVGNFACTACLFGKENMSIKSPLRHVAWHSRAYGHVADWKERLSEDTGASVRCGGTAKPGSCYGPQDMPRDQLGSRERSKHEILPKFSV